MKSVMKRFGWILPAAALAVGAFALVPGAVASSNEANLPMPTEVAASGQTQAVAGTDTVNGQDWNVMAISGSVYKP